jgi:hypothetical protein
MKSARQLLSVVLLTMLVTPLFAAEDDSEAFGQFQKIMTTLDPGSFEAFRKALDKTDMMNRVDSGQTFEPDVWQTFSASFWSIIESGFQQGLPPVASESDVDLVDFAFQDGRGRAVVRFSLPKYQYVFHVFEIKHDKRSRLIIVDWFDSAKGNFFTAQVGEELVTLKPTKEATRKLFSLDGASDLELFQLTEILKANRDKQPPRFFEIYDGFDDQLKKQAMLVKYAVVMAFLLKDTGRFEESLSVFCDVYSSDPNVALMMSDYYSATKNYEQMYETLKKFHENFSVKEGALPAKLSALALALGKAEDAEKFAVEATINEPALELGWWSLLRARARNQDYAGSLDALTNLEDLFDHTLDEAKLQRDKFRGFTDLVASQEFKDWRASRD